MKKSKIIGLSLGFSALAAVAISTPFIVTSCSSSTDNSTSTNEKITGTIKNTALTGTITATTEGASAENIAADNIVGGENSITVYTAEKFGTVSLTLASTLSNIIDTTDFTNVDTIDWTISGSDATLKDGVITAKIIDASSKVEVTLTATIKGTKTTATAKADENVDGGETSKPAEGEEAKPTETPKAEAVIRDLSIKLIILGSNKPAQ